MPSGNPEKGLSDPQERFAQAYVKSSNATEAYTVAYPKASRKSASAAGVRLLGNVKIAVRVALLQEAVNRECHVDAVWVRQRFKNISDRCMQAEPATDALGHPTGEYRFDASGANKATEQLAKLAGMYAPIRLDLSGMTDAELESLARGTGPARA